MLYRKLLRPLLFKLPPETAHELALHALTLGLGTEAALARRLEKGKPDCVLGVNIGKSRAVPVEEATADYLASFELVRPHADYVAVNVSSPNTPGLRELQRADPLAALLSALQARNREL